MVDKISLLTPFYNADRFVERFHCQIQRLSRPFDEVLLYDDASTDGSAQRLRDLGYTVVTGDRNIGPGAARNRLAEFSSSEWIHFHDIDDELCPDYVSSVSNVLDNSIDFLVHDVQFIDEATRSLVIEFRWGPEIHKDPALFLLQSPLPTQCGVIRRTTFLGAGGFAEDLRCFEDGDMHFRLAVEGARVATLRGPLELALRHSEGASRDMNYCLLCRVKFLERYLSAAPRRLLPAIRDEFYVAAKRFIENGNKNEAGPVLQRYLALGGRFPVTESRAIRFLSAMMPPSRIVELQVEYAKIIHWWRAAKRRARG